jgi:hypothetical protein
MIDEYISMIPKAKSEAIKSRYEAKIDMLDTQIRELSRDAERESTPNIEEALELTFRLLGTPAETWLSSSKNTKIMLHNMIFVENPTYSVNTGFGTVKLSLPFLLKKDNLVTKCSMVDPAGVEPASERRRTVVDERRGALRLLRTRYPGRSCATYT